MQLIGMGKFTNMHITCIYLKIYLRGKVAISHFNGFYDPRGRLAAELLRSLTFEVTIEIAIAATAPCPNSL